MRRRRSRTQAFGGGRARGARPSRGGAGALTGGASAASPFSARPWLVMMVALLLVPVVPAFAAFNPTNAPMEVLVGWAQRYGSTPEKKQNRALARDELFARGGAGLRFLLENVHLTNETVRTLIDEMVRSRLPGTNSAPVLAEFLNDPEPAARRMAAYYLVFTDATNLSVRLLPLLTNDVTAGAAARTLGKWKIRAALPGIVALLDSPKEPRRVVAVNALRDIGDPAAIPELIGALGDGAFTVRKVAARALATFGRPAELALLRALPDSAGTAQREMVRTLGAMKSRRAVKPLRQMLAGAEDGLRADIAQALRAIDPPRAVHRAIRVRN